jgi:hypothetical protein
MAQLSSASKKRHDLRKNPASREFFEKQRHEQNMKRPKQQFVGGETVAEGGYWKREA